MPSIEGTASRCGGAGGRAPRVVAVVGPTAAGKSALAVDLALHLDGEVVNADSMQVYRGMDIGTAKPTMADRRGVPHHLFDVLDVRETSTVADLQRWARQAIEGLRAVGRTPVVVGGSALYIRAILDRFEFPGTVAEVRARLEAELAETGPGALHARLRHLDPVAAADILPTNGRRLVRALEVIEITGRPFRATLPPHDYATDGVVQIGLDVPRDVLDRRVEERVRRMWDDGFVDEVRRLAAAGLREGRTASRALGYRQVLDLLAGKVSESRAFEETVSRTRRFVRRQDSWFRRDLRIQWLRYDASALVPQALRIVGIAERP